MNGQDTAGGTAAIGWSADGTLEVLRFVMGGEAFAIEAVQVREILDLLPETRVPGAHPLVGSVVNFRGRIIPLADLRRAFGMQAEPPTADSRIIVIEVDLVGEPLLVGLRTDKVQEVTTLDRQCADDPPDIGLRWPRRFLRALVRRDGDLIVLPDITGLFIEPAGIVPGGTIH